MLGCEMDVEGMCADVDGAGALVSGSLSFCSPSLVEGFDIADESGVVVDTGFVILGGGRIGTA